MATRAELDWAGGIFDGEGSVSLIRVPARDGRRERWVVQLSVSNNHRPTVERFCEIVGCGKVYPRRERPPARASYHWMISALAAEAALRLLKPHVFTKARQIDLAIEARALKQTARFVGASPSVLRQLRAISEEIRSLNGVHGQRRRREAVES